MSEFFTADTHFKHANIIKYCSRPFASAEAMTEQLIANWNATVGYDDTVYHLGDFAFCNDGEAKAIADRLNGNIVLVLGNHDRRIARHIGSLFGNRFVEIYKDPIKLQLDGYTVTLGHYPIDVFDTDWMLHGHCHGTNPVKSNMLDVGVDVHKYRPVSFDAVATHMLGKLQ
jgi:calcineurin-like phosphoesterase family protein